jgi:hypothetical protein
VEKKGKTAHEKSRKGGGGINNFSTENLAAEKKDVKIPERGESGEMLAEPNMDAILPASLFHT